VKRDEYSYTDDALPLLVKSGDFEGIKWMFEKGFPMNWKVTDSDGMSYHSSELASHHGQQAIADYFRQKEKAGPPRQVVSLRYGNKESEFIMANSREDWIMFKDEVARHFGIKKFKIIARGDEEQKKLKWQQLREKRKYMVVLI